MAGTSDRHPIAAKIRLSHAIVLATLTKAMIMKSNFERLALPVGLLLALGCGARSPLDSLDDQSPVSSGGNGGFIGSGGYGGFIGSGGRPGTGGTFGSGGRPGSGGIPNVGGNAGGTAGMGPGGSPVGGSKGGAAGSGFGGQVGGSRGGAGGGGLGGQVGGGWRFTRDGWTHRRGAARPVRALVAASCARRQHLVIRELAATPDWMEGIPEGTFETLAETASQVRAAPSLLAAPAEPAALPVQVWRAMKS
jgi:hypothetical protein